MSDQIVVKGLVISETKHGEYNKIISVYTAGEGMIRIYCYGAMSIKNRNFAATQPFCYSEFELSQKDDDYTLKSASVIRYFYSAKLGLPSFALMSYIAETLQASAIESGDDGEILRLTLNVLHAISSGKKDLRIIKAAFEIRSAGILGFSPELQGECIVCRKKSASFFDYESGGLVCPDCMTTLPGKRLGGTVDRAVEDCVNYILSCDEKKMLSFSLPEDEIPLLSSIAEGYLTYQLDRRFPSLEFYKSVVKN